MNISAFVITLERAKERKVHVEWLLQNLPLPSSPVSAVDGSLLTQAELNACYSRQIHSPIYPHPLSRGEVGCFLSHRKVWQAIVDQNLDAAFILEDDATFVPETLNSALTDACRQISPGEYLQFQAREIPYSPVQKSSEHEYSVIQPCPVHLRTTAQIVTREAAARLLEVSAVFDRPVDTFLQMTWLTTVPVKVIVPRVIDEISLQLGGSTLGTRRRPWFEHLRREILRPVYRAQIRYLSRKAS